VLLQVGRSFLREAIGHGHEIRKNGVRVLFRLKMDSDTI